MNYALEEIFAISTILPYAVGNWNKNQLLRHLLPAPSAE